MLTPLFVIGIVLVGVAARLIGRAVLVPRLALKAHLREIDEYGYKSAFEDLDLSRRERWRRSLRRNAARAGEFMMRRFPSVTALSAGELNAAGYYDVEPTVAHGYRVFATVGLPAVLLLLALVGGGLSVLSLMLVGVGGLGGWMVPSVYVRRRGASRLSEIDRRLPELIDLLIATVEAGMGLGAAIDLVAGRFDGPLGDELRLTVRQQSLGMSIPTALGEMVERCDTPSVRAFARTAMRGESLGVSIGPVLRELSADERRRHRMAARTKMQKAPIKMIFPLIFLIFPALMMVLFYPAIYTITHTAHGVF
ncbi:MAG: type II secretion system F family protein [Solirubrobacterales bacterium]|nr:type II secretion system F family protein [Solirubrobacterales bacterium]